MGAVVSSDDDQRRSSEEDTENDDSDHERDSDSETEESEEESEEESGMLASFRGTLGLRLGNFMLKYFLSQNYAVVVNLFKLGTV